ncbi:MAG: discoidin domain-containing protein [Bacteroidetes bacterium]|nr:discoidin domain-containing protein [Bacteroidota bacterium]
MMNARKLHADGRQYCRAVFVLAFAAVVQLAGCRPDEPLIDHASVFDKYDWWDSRDRDWYAARIPFVDTPDDSLDEVYYYRWEVVKTHLTYGSPSTGYLFTEFIDRPFWSGTYGGIACPLGHQLAEVRWLKDPRIIDDFARYWLDTPGARPRNYSNWYGSGIWQIHELWSDRDWAISMLPYVEKQIAGWYDEWYDADHGLFYRTGHDDGMEVNINARQASDDWRVEGYRPTLNSYLYGDLNAAASLSALAGDAAKAQSYTDKADALRSRVIEQLWDSTRAFFFHQWVADHPPGIKAKTLTYQTGPFAGNEHGRELIGYVPWQFNLPTDEQSSAWQFLMDTTYFMSTYGPTTTEQHDPQFYVSPRCCVWSGQSWPYATTQTLVAMANLLNNYDQDYVDGGDYYELIRAYTRTQYKNGRPYVAESANPFDGSWTGSDLPNHSEHYFHSGYVDLVLGGLLGIRPTAGDTLVLNPLVPADWRYFAVDGVRYHGRDLSFYWDADGSRYGRESGFVVIVDGKQVYRGDTIGRVAQPIEPAANSLSFERRDNLAVNNGELWPEVTTSYANPSNPSFYLHDGGIWYHQVPTNRWTTVGSPNSGDTVTVDFGVAQTVNEVRLYFIDDSVGEQSASERQTTVVMPPVSYRIEVRVDSPDESEAVWTSLVETRRTPSRPEGRRANTVEFRAVDARAVRVILEHAAGGATGLAELEVWTPAGTLLSKAQGRPSNLALNPAGDPFPRVSASFPEDDEGLGVLVDGSFGLTSYQANRWVPRGTPNAEDWIEIEFDGPKSVSRVDAYLWGNAPRYLNQVDTTVISPRSMHVRVRVGGEWRDVLNASSFPQSPRAMAVNVISFQAVEADAVRLYLEHDRPAVGGLTEVEVR